MTRPKASDCSGHRRRLKERYLSSGITALHPYEAVELLLTFAVPRRDVKPLAKELTRRFGSLRGIIQAEPAEILDVPGVGHHALALIKLVKDLADLVLKEKARNRVQISCTQELLDYCRCSMGGLKEEQFRIIYLDTRNRMMDVDILEKGVVNQAVVYPRKVIEHALKRKASALILVHNHPSGHVVPSEADIRLTRTIEEAARVLDILIHDHLIVGEEKVFSFREEGMMR